VNHGRCGLHAQDEGGRWTPVLENGRIVCARLASSATSTLELRLLGGVEARRDGQALPLGGRRQEALLALLMLARGRVVTTDHLIDQLWGGEPPDGAPATLRSYVSRLRTVLGDDAPIRGRAGGYLLEVDPDALDVERFERLVRDGHEALVRGDARAANDRLGVALELWRGQALAGHADDGDLRVAAERLDEVYLAARESRLQAALDLGEAAGLIDELNALVTAHPYREALWAKLMLALYRAGRQADALAAYQRAWALFRDELGLELGEDLRALEAAIVRQDVPGVRSVGQRDSMPHATTTFIGRERELEQIAGHLRTARLVTLTGIGGVGKTRLALESAGRAGETWTDGRWFVDLSALTEPGLVAREVAGALGVVEQSDESVVERLAARLRPVRALLVLDNCEHLREACADLANRLLAIAPDLRILATSREPLGVAGEVDVAVQPLSTPAAHDAPATIESSDAVRLFLARARDARPGIDADPANLAAIAAIARDLDGLPLAIELAAARVKAFSIAQIATRIEDRFRFLVSWRRLAPDRHRTLKEAMDWSYDLLDARQQELLRGLSVFAGGFTLDAVAAVCLAHDDAAAADLLEHLVDASLVVAEERGGEMRYRLLETVRQYAVALLDEAGDARTVAAAHATWFLELAERVEPDLTRDRQTAALATLETEHDNLRAALSHLDTDAGAADRLRLVTALSRFWYVRGYLAESRRWLERALEDVADAPPLLRRRALTAASAVALLQGDYAAGVAFSEGSLAAAREADDPRLIANGLSNLGAITLAAGDRAGARTLLEEAVELARTVDDERIAALAINNLGDLALTEGDYPRARPLFEESLAILRRRGDAANIARSLFNLGSVELMLGSTAEAAGCFRESIELGRETGDKEDLAWCLLGVADVAARTGDGLRAATLLGSGVALLDAIGAAFKPFERHLHDDAVERAQARIGADAYERAREEGAALSLEAAIAAALEVAEERQGG
jgi:predicted ATPase/DNA-binding SARP family transcriptional activator